MSNTLGAKIAGPFRDTRDSRNVHLFFLVGAGLRCWTRTP